MSQVADALTGPPRAPRAEGPVVSGLRGGVTRPAADAAAAPVSDAPGGSARRPRPRIAIRPAPYGSVRRLEIELGVSPVVAQVLVRRGLADPARAGDWLAADERHRLEEFGGLADAAERLLGHIRAGTRITVHGDYDVDGVCSTAILLEAIEGLGGRVDWHLPARDDGYGLSTATVERLAGRGTGCLLCVDCGITAVAEVAAARAAGLDAIVCDHHAPRADGALPDAAIVHPALGRYPCPELCAAGVAHRLAAALLRAAGEDEHRADAALDLVALATVADVVPLRGENRRLVREGLRALATTARPGLRALMSVAGCDAGRLDARAIGFGLAPRINAAGRVARADAALELVRCTDPDRAAAVADELDALNRERRAIETRMGFAAEAQVSAAGQRPAYVVAGEDWHRGVVGIVAGRLAERHHRPVVAIALHGDRGTGSGRSIPGYDLLAGLTAVRSHLVRFGGHRAAAGLEIETSAVGDLRAGLEAHVAASLDADALVPELEVDAVAGGDDLDLALAEGLEALAPFGHGNPDPALLVCAASFSEATAMGEGRHARFTLQAGGVRSRAVCFGQGGRAPARPGVPVDVVAGLERHRWAGVEEPRIVVRGVRPCAPAPVTRPATLAPGPATLAPRPATLAPGPATLGPGPARLAPAASALEPETGRTVCDSRGRGLAGTLGALVATGETVLVACADVERRLEGLAGRLGGFALASHEELAQDSAPAFGATHLVALDPPAGHAQDRALRRGPPTGFTHLAWGEPELRFAGHVLEQEYDLRAPLATLYRRLRGSGGVEGPALEAALRGDGARPWSPALGQRLLVVLHELGLAVLDPGGDRVTLCSPPAARVALERSATFRACRARLEEGRRWLSVADAKAA